jgi:predicted DCC family thiol-disulfide oxidoreductase YuxK
MSTGSEANESWSVDVFYDGDCPLCMREVRMLMRRDRSHRIKFTNIAAPGFDANAIQPGLAYAALMKRIHARLPSGELIEGIEVFRRLYDAIGFGPLVKMSRAPGISQLLDVAYNAFAKNRLRLTGRCETDACEVPATRGT